MVFLCLDHHSQYDSRTSQHKNYTVGELKQAKADLCDAISQGAHIAHLSSVGPQDQREADRKILGDLLGSLPSSGVMTFLRENDFGSAFRFEELLELRRYVAERRGPEHEFLDQQIESARQRFLKAAQQFLGTLARYTVPTPKAGLFSIPGKWEDAPPETYQTAADLINEAADAACAEYESLVRLARRKLGR